MIPQLVPRRDLPNAIALNSTQFNLSRVLGPTAGGIVLALVGTAGCFALNGLSFFFVVFALAQLRLPPHMPPDHENEAGHGASQWPALRPRQPVDADAHDPRVCQHVPDDADSDDAAVVCDRRAHEQRARAADAAVDAARVSGTGIDCRRAHDWQPRPLQAHGTRAARRASRPRHAHRRICVFTHADAQPAVCSSSSACSSWPCSPSASRSCSSRRPIICAAAS